MGGSRGEASLNADNFTHSFDPFLSVLKCYPVRGCLRRTLLLALALGGLAGCASDQPKAPGSPPPARPETPAEAVPEAKPSPPIPKRKPPIPPSPQQNAPNQEPSNETELA